MAHHDSPFDGFPLYGFPLGGSSLDGSPFDDAVPRRPVHATTLITAIPALLGFVPDRSLIVLTFRRDHTIIATMRYDLLLRQDGRPSTELRATIAGIGELGREYGAEAVVAVIADDRHRIEGPEYRTVLALCERAFASCGGLSAGLITPRIAQGQRWWAGRGGPTGAGVPAPVQVPASREGLVDDPHTSPTAVREAVTTGRRVLDCRDELTTMLDPLTCECRSCTGPAGSGGEGAAPLRDSAALLGLVLAHLRRGQARPDTIGCADAAALATALTDLTVRDALLALAVTDLRGDAETLWRTLARRLNGTARASAASLLAHLHYLAGEGAYAAVALDCALDADPDWSFAVLLSQALHTGAHPAMLWDIIGHSYELTASLGVVLPPPTAVQVGR